MRKDIDEPTSYKHKKRLNPWKYPTSQKSAHEIPAGIQAEPSPLLKVLSRGLPDLCYENGICDIKRLAAELGITRQGVHKWVNPNKRNHIPAKSAMRIMQLSKEQKTGGAGFVPLSREDFFPFVF